MAVRKWGGGYEIKCPETSVSQMDYGDACPSPSIIINDFREVGIIEILHIQLL